MANPLYPSLIPRYVDESWFASDQPVDEAAKLNELEANHEVWIREAPYRNVDVHSHHLEHIGSEFNEEEEEEEEAQNDDDDDDEIEAGDEVEEDYMGDDMQS